MLVVVPARGGSTRIPGKNVAEVGGRPLLTWTLEAAASIDADVVVSTDDDGIARIAREGGIEVIDRPAELATATASTESVLLHALDSLVHRQREYDWVVTLPPTSPLRSGPTVARFAAEALAAAADVDCLFSVHEDRGDYWRRSGTSWTRLFPDAPRRQQDREPLFEENSAIYVTRVDALRRTGSILGERPVGLVIDAIEATDVNTPLDLAIADALLTGHSS